MISSWNRANDRLFGEPFGTAFVKLTKGGRIMKRFVLSLLSALMIFCIAITVCAQSVFSDVRDDAWFAADVQYVTENGIFNGTSEDTFSPSAPFTRAMFVVTLGRLHGIEPSAYNWKVLGDVSPDDWYGPYVAWAYDNAITQSMGNDDFRPDYNVTREQMATFIARYLKKYAEKQSENKTFSCDYADKASISGFAVESIAFCSEIGILKGDENGNFRPQDGITRAEAAAVIARLQKYLAKD